MQNGIEEAEDELLKLKGILNKRKDDYLPEEFNYQKQEIDEAIDNMFYKYISYFSSTYEAIDKYLKFQNDAPKNTSLYYTDTFINYVYDKLNALPTLTKNNLEVLNYFQIYQYRGGSSICPTQDSSFINYLNRLNETCRTSSFFSYSDFVISERNSSFYSIFNEIKPKPSPIYENYIRGYIVDTQGFYTTLENIDLSSRSSALGLVSRGFIDTYTRIVILNINILCRHLNILAPVNIYFDLSNYDSVKVYQIVNMVNIQPTSGLVNKTYFLLGIIIGAVLLLLSLLEMFIIRDHYEIYWKYVRIASFIDFLGYFYIKIPTLFELLNIATLLIMFDVQATLDFFDSELANINLAASQYYHPIELINHELKFTYEFALGLILITVSFIKFPTFFSVRLKLYFYSIYKFFSDSFSFLILTLFVIFIFTMVTYFNMGSEYSAFDSIPNTLAKIIGLSLKNDIFKGYEHSPALELERYRLFHQGDTILIILTQSISLLIVLNFIIFQFLTVNYIESLEISRTYLSRELEVLSFLNILENRKMSRDTRRGADTNLEDVKIIQI